MRRRPKPEADRPVWLAYRPEDWTGKGCHPECAYWEAVKVWRDEHPDGDVPTGGPDTPWHPELI